VRDVEVLDKGDFEGEIYHTCTAWSMTEKTEDFIHKQIDKTQSLFFSLAEAGNTNTDKLMSVTIGQNFREKGWLLDAIHYNQTALNEIGETAPKYILTQPLK